MHEDRDAEDHGANVFGRRGLEQIGATAGAVADIVTYEVGDHRRVPRVVLRNTGFHLAHEVGAHVGRLRVDAATQLGEQRYKASAEPESDDARWRELRVRPVG